MLTARKRDDLLEGDTLKITLDGVITSKNAQHSCVLVTDEVGWNHWIYLESPSVSAEVTGRNINPQKGDVYAVGTTPGIWIATENILGVKKMVSSSGVEYSVKNFNNAYKQKVIRKVYPV